MDAFVAERGTRRQNDGSTQVSTGLRKNRNDEVSDVVLECPWCGTKSMRRLKRFGFFEERLLPKLGVYPWECYECREVRYFRNRGRTREGNNSSDQSVA